MVEITLSRTKKLSKNYNSIGYEITVTGENNEDIMHSMSDLIINEEQRLGEFIATVETQPPPPQQRQRGPQQQQAPFGYGQCIVCGQSFAYQKANDRNWKRKCTPCWQSGA